ncbi:MAG: hypothetical protein AB7H80_04415 [Candidatus Kapaibacterium sp.]
MKHPYVFQRILCGISLFGCLLCTLSASAQIFPNRTGQPPPLPTSQSQRIETRFLAGVSLSGSLAEYSNGIPMVYTPICNHLEAGSGLGYAAGITTEYLLSRSLSLSLNARYGSHPGSFERAEVVGTTTVRTGEEPGFLLVRINSDIAYEAIETDLLLKWTAGEMRGGRNGLGFAIGPTLSVPLKGTMTQNHTLEVYRTGGEFLTRRDLEVFGGEEVSHRNLTEGEEMTRMKDVHYGLRTGLFLNYDLGAGVYVTPGLYADLPLTSFTDFDWGSLTRYGLQVDLMFGI